MKAFFLSVKNWFLSHAPTKRRLIQVYAALLYNANLKGYISGEIFQGNSKYVCVPGMNCYSCPGAVAACPLGALQNALSASNNRSAYYVLGILGLFGLMLGRTICGFLCPVGLGQDLLNKIKTPKLRKNRVTRVLSYLKYVLLVVLVVAIPVMYSIQGNPGTPGFCKTICPAGTFGGGLGLLLHPNNRAYLDMLGPIFTWKFALMVAIIVASIFLYRPFCRFLCPLGAIYGFFNRIALMGVKLDKNKCTNCGLCVEHCKMDIKHVGDHECINCGECMSVCPAKAITWKGSKIFLRANDTEPLDHAQAPLNDIRTMNFKPVVAAPAAAVAVAAPAPTEGDAPRIAQFAEESAVDDGGQGYFGDHGGDAPEKTQKPAKRRGKNFWLQFAAWTTALALLLGAILYYNVFDVDRKVYGYGTAEGEYLVKFNATFYDDDSEKSFSEILGENSTMLVLFDDGEESKALIEHLQTSFTDFGSKFPALAEKMKLYALHPADVNGKELIQSEGWNDKIVFGTEAKDYSLVDTFGESEQDEQSSKAEEVKELSYPVIFSLDNRGIITSRKDGSLEADEVEALIYNANTGSEAGKLCPDFIVRRYKKTESGSFGLTEETFSPYEHIGEVTVINFWATWCGPCVAEIPHFNRVATEFPELNIVAIHGVDGDNSKVTKFIREKTDETGTKWTDYDLLFAQDNLDGTTCLTFKLFGGKGTWPMTFVVGKDGIITFSRIGSLDYETLRAEVVKALEA